MPAVAIENVTIRNADGHPIVDDVSMQIEAGESVTLLGRSGAGKTTLLRLMNRLTLPGSGRVLRDGVELNEKNEVELRRRTGYVLQSPALFPHRTVLDNVAVVPRLLGWERGRIESAARPLLDSLGLPHDRFALRFPRTLSGGEQQRVAIARAVISQPSLLLCDEPFSALDPIVRREQQDAFLALWRERKTTLVFVTHDVAEALRIGTRVVLVDEGRIRFDGTPEAFRHANDPLIDRFLEAYRGVDA